MDIGDWFLASNQQDVWDVSIRFAASNQESEWDDRFLCECDHTGMVDVLRAPSGQAVAPGLLPVMSLLFLNSFKIEEVAQVAGTREGPVVFVSVVPGLVYECHGRASPARIQGARTALPMTSMQVECGKNDHAITHTPKHEEH